MDSTTRDAVINAIPSAVKLTLPGTNVNVASIEERIIKNYFDFIKEIGKGASGVVWEAELIDPLKTPEGPILSVGTRVAIKIQDMKKNDLLNAAAEVIALREVSKSACPSVGKIYEVFYDSTTEKMFFVMQLIVGPNFNDYSLWDKTSFSKKIIDTVENGEDPSTVVSEDEIIENFINPIIDAVKCLHRHNIAHRDIKNENIMLDTKTKQPILIDFGLSCVSACDGKTVGTPRMLAPEVLTKRMNKTNVEEWKKADLWSLGCAIYELLSDDLYPLQDVIRFLDNTDNIEEIIVANQGEPDLSAIPDSYPKIKKLLNGLLQIDPSTRVLNW